MTAPMHPVVRIRFFTEEKCFGPGIAQLLEHIREEKSLRKAALAMGMAYSKAWTILKHSEKYLGFALVMSASGGAGGGGTVLTEQAEKLLTDYREYTRRVEEYAQKTFREVFG